MYNDDMKDTMNTLFATLLIVIAGAAAGWLIYRLATTDNLTNNFGGAEVKYAPLQESILNQ